jgi:hypothetical protein
MPAIEATVSTMASAVGIPASALSGVEVRRSVRAIVMALLPPATTPPLVPIQREA